MTAPLLHLAIGVLLSAPPADATAPAKAEGPAPADGAAPAADDDAPPAAAEDEPPPNPEAGPAEPESPTPEGPEISEGEESDEADADAALANAGVAGNLVDKDDPNAGRATADLEGEALGKAGVDVPDRMRPLQAGAWWSLFVTTGLATTGGVLAGLAERQEDELTRVTQLVNLQTGSSYEYADVSDPYEDMVKRGEQLSWGARGFFIASAATAVTSLTLFIMDHKQQKKRRVSFGPGAATVRF